MPRPVPSPASRRCVKSASRSTSPMAASSATVRRRARRDCSRAREAAPLGPKEEYDEAVAMLKAGKFEAAEKSLQVFLAKNPKSKFAPAATFNHRRELFPARKASRSGGKISRDFHQIRPVGAGPGRLAAAGPVARRHGRQGTGLRLLQRDRREISRLGGAHPRRGAARKQEIAMLTRRGARDA